MRPAGLESTAGRARAPQRAGGRAGLTWAPLADPLVGFLGGSLDMRWLSVAGWAAAIGSVGAQDCTFQNEIDPYTMYNDLNGDSTAQRYVSESAAPWRHS